MFEKEDKDKVMYIVCPDDVNISILYYIYTILILLLLHNSLVHFPMLMDVCE